MARSFGYAGKPGTCLWCGRPFRESYSTVWPPKEPPKPGESFYTRVVREVVPYARRGRGLRPAGAGDRILEFRVFFDPPIWEADYLDDPFFDTKTCAQSFGLRLAQIGHRLERKR